jgi:Domain of unknown function (DUF4932)/Bacterial Ig-like domain
MPRHIETAATTLSACARLGHSARRSLPFLACTVWAQPVAAQAIQVRTDSRIELLSIVFHLAGADEYNQGRVPSYVRDVDTWFRLFRDYPVVRRARVLKDSAGIGFSDPMEFALHLTNAHDLGEIVPVDAPDQQPEWAWRPADARAFLSDLRTFAREAQTDRFLRSHERLYATAVDRLRQLVDSAGDPKWFGRFFGHFPVKPFTIVPALLNGGGNYGPRIRTPADGEEFYAIVGVYLTDRDGLPYFDEREMPNIVHEFSHSFINPIIARHLDQFESAGPQVLAAEEQQMKDQSYDTWPTVITESLVRATVVRYRLSHEGPEAADAEIAAQKARGFLWIRDLSNVLGQYETARGQYPDFEAFLPRVAGYFESLPALLPALAVEYDSTRPRVVRLSPANGATGVGASTGRIRVWFDQPMADGMLVNPIQEDSGASLPEITGKGEFDESRTRFTLPVRLEPGRSYALAFGARFDKGFRSEAGVPLARVVLRFRTEGAQ